MPHGIYWYNSGFNWRAFVAWLVATTLLFPGMLYSMGVPIHNRGILNMYSRNYVLVVVFSGLLYFIYTTLSPVPVSTDDADYGKLHLIDELEPESETASTAGYVARGDIEKRAVDDKVATATI